MVTKFKTYDVKNSKYKPGDYILINEPEHNKYNNVMKVSGVGKSNNVYFYVLYDFDDYDKIGKPTEIYEYPNEAHNMNIIKLSLEEVELLNATNKYNL